MRFTPTTLVIAAIAAEALSLASASTSPRHHRGLGQRMKRAVGLAQEDNGMHKRSSYSGTATWYGAGVSEGACGGYNSASDYIVALNTNLYGNTNAQSSWCGKSLVITANGVTQTARVVDACPSCPGSGDLDMSTGLFQSFGKSLGAGEMSISWYPAGQGGSSSNGNSNKKQNKPATTSHRQTTTHTPTHTPTTTSTRSTKTSTRQSTSTSAPSSSSSSTSTATSSSTAAPQATGTTTSTTSTPGNAQNLKGISELVQGLINIANAGH